MKRFWFKNHDNVTEILLELVVTGIIRGLPVGADQ